MCVCVCMYISYVYFRCVPEEECKNDGYFEDSDAPDFGNKVYFSITINVKWLLFDTMLLQD